MQLSPYGLLLLTQPLQSSEQHIRANLEFSSNFGRKGEYREGEEKKLTTHIILRPSKLVLFYLGINTRIYNKLKVPWYLAFELLNHLVAKSDFHGTVYFTSFLLNP